MYDLSVEVLEMDTLDTSTSLKKPSLYILPEASQFLMIEDPKLREIAFQKYLRNLWSEYRRAMWRFWEQARILAAIP